MSTQRPHEPFSPIPALLAFVLPGLGHAYLGETKRGLGVAAGVLGLFLSGLFIGGIDVVDRREDFVWFIGEALVGPIAFGVDYVHQTQFKAWGTEREPSNDRMNNPLVVLRTVGPDEMRVYNETTGRHEAVPRQRAEDPGPPNVKSLGRPNELGTLFCTIAGMLNMIAIVDAGFRTSRRSDDRKLI